MCQVTQPFSPRTFSQEDFRAVWYMHQLPSRHSQESHGACCDFSKGYRTITTSAMTTTTWTTTTTTRQQVGSKFPHPRATENSALFRTQSQHSQQRTLAVHSSASFYFLGLSAGCATGTPGTLPAQYPAGSVDSVLEGPSSLASAPFVNSHSCSRCPFILHKCISTDKHPTAVQRLALYHGVTTEPINLTYHRPYMTILRACPV